ncbi:P-loop containing nucleoside triphosphate hydrolase protein [Xylaria curta]|nr:P-loop containing nucleoside triphosphate hydrolase protein [Xylaria curta]
MRDNVIRLAVFGLTGAGKSSLVVHTTGTPPGIGHGGDPCKEEAQPAQSRVGLKKVIFFNTPGFDDTQSRDLEIFEKISAWLSELFTLGDILAKGAKVIRFQNDKPSALEVARHFANNAATMLLQDELEAYDGQLSDISAAKQFEIDLGNKVTELEFSIKNMGFGNGMVEAIGMAGNIVEIANSCANM